MKKWALVLVIALTSTTYSQSSFELPFKESHENTSNKKRPSASELTNEVSESFSLSPQVKIVRKNFIDDYIFDRIEQDGVPYSGLSTDTEFLRRIYLDLWGRIPDVEQVRKFVIDEDPDKRDKLIDRLLGLDYLETPGYDSYKRGPWMVEKTFLNRWSYWFGDLFLNGPIQ